ncbi:MAG: cation transporter [Flavobacteriales bacterium]|nr:cation transporter [Flavobacteriales bacterium]
MRTARANIRTQVVVVVMGALLMGLKFLAWRITHSNAVLSDALESIVNVVAGAFALYSLLLAAKPRDREHPYGHGKVEFISAGIEGGMIGIAGIFIIIRALLALMHGHQVHELGSGIALTGGAGAVNLVMGLLLRRRGRRSHSITMEAGGTHLLSDAWSTLAMLVGLSLILITGEQRLDALFAIGFGVFILVQGVRVLRRSVAGIMDETDMVVAAEMVSILEHERRPDWVDLHNFRVIKFGSTLHIDCHATLPWYYTLEQAHERIATMEHLVNARYDRRVELFIHMDPCLPASCAICALDDCPERRQTFQRRITWELATVLDNAKHGSDDVPPSGS